MPQNAKRVEDMTPEERLQSLKDWAEEQKYVRPGEGGTLPFGVGSMQGLVYGGPVRLVQSQYTAPIGPPSYETAMRSKSESSSKKPGPVKKWLDKRKAKKEQKMRRDCAVDEAPPYTERPT